MRRINKKKRLNLFVTALMVFAFTACLPERNNPWDERAYIDPEKWVAKNIVIEDISVSAKMIIWEYDADKRIEGFQIDRKVGDHPWVESYGITSTQERSFLDNSITPDTNLTITYRLITFANTNKSNYLSIATKPIFPSPSNLQVIIDSGPLVILNWSDNSNGEDGFVIDRKIGDNDWETGYARVDENQNTYIDSDFSYNGNNYFYRVYAYFDKQYSGFTEVDLLPIVTTNEVNNITGCTAISGGNVITAGAISLLARGIIWGTNTDLTLQNALGSTNEGNSIGVFSSELTSLTINTNFFVRAYASNNVGTSYGSVLSFATTNGLPVVNTFDIVDINATSASSGGSISSNGGFNIIDKGLVWSGFQYPTITDNEGISSAGQGTNDFSSNIINLSPSKTYYVRAFAYNEQGVGYGEQKSFTTTKLPPWKKIADVGGESGLIRENAVGFSIGEYGYIGTGNWSISNYNDFWEYNPSTEVWSQKANFGGVVRTYAVGIAVNGKGYIGLGEGGGSPRKDFWEYNPSTNTWTKIADFGGIVRRNATGFGIGEKIYVGTGINGTYPQKDFWEYNPSTNTWSQKANFGGGDRTSAVGFSIGNKGYIGTGHDGDSRKNDFWEYNPTNNTWTQKANFGGEPRTGSVGFVLNGKGYIGTGWNGTTSLNDFWEYDPNTNTWSKRTNVGNSSRYGAVGFSIGNKGYIGTGRVDGFESKDFWEYDPTQE
ncbi:MAG: kelch repeat-containing protein [Tenuifilaceae bacterium]|jgi:N-acetylneuraminic acid mutarotase|nr:kelch repeat-containing protein [Tenuifilaceae bacterium]